MTNARWKIGLAVATLICLSLPSAVGIYRALEPARGPWAAGAAALGIELVYLTLGLLSLSPAAKRAAGRVIVGALAVGVLLNIIADYNARTGDGLKTWAQFVATFDGLALGLATAEALALGLLSYALADLLHRLDAPNVPNTEEHPPALLSPVPASEGMTVPLWAGPVGAQPLTLPRQIVFPAPVLQAGTPQTPDLAGAGPVLQAATRQTAPTPHICKRCGAGPFSFADLGRHSRQCGKEPPR